MIIQKKPIGTYVSIDVAVDLISTKVISSKGFFKGGKFVHVLGRSPSKGSVTCLVSTLPSLWTTLTSMFWNQIIIKVLHIPWGQGSPSPGSMGNLWLYPLGRSPPLSKGTSEIFWQFSELFFFFEMSIIESQNLVCFFTIALVCSTALLCFKCSSAKDTKNVWLLLLLLLFHYCSEAFFSRFFFDIPSSTYDIFLSFSQNTHQRPKPIFISSFAIQQPTVNRKVFF